MQQQVGLVIAGLALICVLASLVVLTRDKHSDRGATALALFISVSLVAYETQLVGSRTVVQLSILVLASAWGILLLIVRPDYWRQGVVPAAFLPAVMAALVFLTNSLANPSSSLVDLLARAGPVFFWAVLGLVFSASHISPRSVAAIGGALLGLSSLASFSSDPWRACDQFKCGLFNGIFTGPFGSENYLAQVAAVAAILVTVSGAGRIRVLVLVLCGVVLIAATSRTAALSLGLSFVFGYLLSRTPNSWRSGVLPWVVLVFMLTSTYVVASAEPADFSNRGGIWLRTLRVVEGSELAGLGISRWSQYQNIGLLPPTNFPHNQLVLLFFATGVLGCVLYGIVLWRLFRLVVLNDATVVSGFTLLCYILISGITEVMWNPGTVDGHSVPILASLILLACLTKDHEPAPLLRAPTRKKDRPRLAKTEDS
ncbi:O-antigen ligase family protein [Microbacterium sp. A196]|uniref:O-antigen ligase family protein n=1 Tax=Microbacterium sp. A196 TaxID=3457320 RepID=UPI003FD4E660